LARKVRMECEANTWRGVYCSAAVYVGSIVEKRFSKSKAVTKTGASVWPGCVSSFLL
jgi:hypothetical protein